MLNERGMMRVYDIRFWRTTGKPITYRTAARDSELMAVALAAWALAMRDPEGDLAWVELLEQSIADPGVREVGVLGEPTLSDLRGIPGPATEYLGPFIVEFTLTTGEQVAYRVFSPLPLMAVAIATSRLCWVRPEAVIVDVQIVDEPHVEVDEALLVDYFAHR